VTSPFLPIDPPLRAGKTDNVFTEPPTTGDEVPGFDLARCLSQLAERSPGKTEADIQADVRDVLLYGGFDLGGEHVRLEAPAEDRKRIDVEIGAVVIECKRDLRPTATRRDAEDQLLGYLRGRQTSNGRAYAGILTDGADWRYYVVQEDALQQVSRLQIRTDEGGEREFRRWLGAILATEHQLKPTAATIEERLGADSPACAALLSELASLWQHAAHLPAAKLKRSLWGKLLRTALGTQFNDEDELFVEHTYLVLTADLIAHAVVGFDLDAAGFSPAVALSGQLFAEAGLEGVGEAGFFDWVLDAPDGEQVVFDIARRVSCFAWEGVDHDVLKALYQSVISPETRHRLGEYYTPDWLAARMVETTIVRPLEQRVLDPACGSGTFLFHAVRRFLDAAEAKEMSVAEAVAEVTQHVFGMDLHPVAVTLAQVTYLVAIGRERLSARSDRLSVPVYLGDSMRWEAPETSFLAPSGEVVVPTDDGQRLLPTELRFPAAVVSDVARFDQLVDALAERASNRVSGSARPTISGLLNRFAVAGSDRGVLEETYQLLCDLHDEGRDHIWAFYVRNQARPAWFSQQDHRVDVLVGNPPWLSFRFMPPAMQATFVVRAKERSLWVGGARGRTTQQDLSAYFVARSIELYLQIGGEFGFVMPLAATSRKQYEGFRRGDFPSAAEACAVAFDEPWDLRSVDPQPFPVPAAVIFGHRVSSSHFRARKSLPTKHLLLTGRVQPGESTSAGLTESHVSGAAFTATDLSRSLYGDRFRSGAALFPRALVFVKDAPPGPMGVPRGSRSIVSRRARLEKEPWRSLPDQRGVVESIFVRSVYLGEHVLPFQAVAPAEAVIPYDGKALMEPTDERIDRYPGLASWLRQAESTWEAHRTTDKRTLVQQLDYMHQLLAQFPTAPTRAVYSASGTYLAAAIVTDPRTIIEHGLYWAATSSLEEARYLTAILNSSALGDLVRPFQALGAFGPRHFDKYIWRMPIPIYEATNDHHRDLVTLAERAEAISAATDLSQTATFQRGRRLIRDALDADGVSRALDQAVRELFRTRRIETDR
jgi:SAM-dependent methyltransferase